MTWVAIAVAGVGLVGAAVSADSASDAADAQSDANKLSLDEQARQFDAAREDEKFYFYAQMAADEQMYQRNKADKEKAYQRVRGDNIGAITRGEDSGNQLQYLMGLGDKGTGEKGWLAKQFTEADMVKDGGYDFRMGEGQKSVGNQFAASGNLLSGAAMKALTRFNQDFASNEYNNAYSRFNTDQNTQYNRLAGIQTAGQNAVNSVAGNSSVVQGNSTNAPTAFAGLSASSNSAYSNALASNAANQGNINANLAMARGQAFNQGLGGLTNAWNTYQTQRQNPTWSNSNTWQPSSGGYDMGNGTYGNGPSNYGYETPSFFGYEG